MPGKYGYINGVTREHSLDEMKVDIKTGNIFWVSAQCNKEEWKQGDGLSNVLWFPFTLGFRGRCVWVGGYSTPRNLEHELMHSQIIRFSKRYTY